MHSCVPPLAPADPLGGLTQLANWTARPLELSPHKNAKRAAQGHASPSSVHAVGPSPAPSARRMDEAARKEAAVTEYRKKLIAHRVSAHRLRLQRPQMRA